MHRMDFNLCLVWGSASSKGKEGSVTTCIRALFSCPECGHDQLCQLLCDVPHCNTLTSLIAITILMRHACIIMLVNSLRKLGIKFWLRAVNDAVKNGNYCIPREHRVYAGYTRPFLPLRRGWPPHYPVLWHTTVTLCTTLTYPALYTLHYTCPFLKETKGRE